LRKGLAGRFASCSPARLGFLAALPQKPRPLPDCKKLNADTLEDAGHCQQVKGKVSPWGARGWSQPFGLLIARRSRKGLQRKSFFAAKRQKRLERKARFLAQSAKNAHIFS
jgi:hypothetical protein